MSWSKISSWLLTVAQAGVLYFITQYLKFTPSLAHLSDVFAIVSVLFVINRVISTIDVTLLNNENTKKLADKIDSAQRPLLNMSKIVDVSDGLKVEQISKLHATYISVTEEKLGAVRDKIIADALKDLVELKTTMRTPVLEEPDFYSWLFQTFDSATRGSTIRIVSMNEDLEWTVLHPDIWTQGRG